MASAQPTNIDFLIVTALEEERDALLAKLPNVSKLEKSRPDSHTYYSALLPTSRGDHSAYQLVVTSLAGMGPIHAASTASDSVQKWNPAHVLFVGIAGGVKGEVRLGDVVVASQIADYTVAKMNEDGTRSVRWEVHRADPNLLDSAINFRTGWEDLVSEGSPLEIVPKRVVGVVASGGDVIAFADLVREYKHTWGKLVAVEMEGGGAASAVAEHTSRPRFVMVRGISDLADAPENATTKAAWRAYAADVAAAYTVGLLRSGPAAARRRTREWEPSSATSAYSILDNGTVSELFAFIQSDQDLRGVHRGQFGKRARSDEEQRQIHSKERLDTKPRLYLTGWPVFILSKYEHALPARLLINRAIAGVLDLFKDGWVRVGLGASSHPDPVGFRAEGSIVSYRHTIRAAHILLRASDQIALPKTILGTMLDVNADLREVPGGWRQCNEEFRSADMWASAYAVGFLSECLQNAEDSHSTMTCYLKPDCCL